MVRNISVLFLFTVFPLFLFSQNEKPYLVRCRVVNGDTLPCLDLPAVNIYDFKIYKKKRNARRNSRLVRNVKKVYPYAKLAGQKLNEYEIILSHAKNKHERRIIMKQVEKEIKDEYGEKLKRLTFSQGKILIKLIDRETGSSSYQLVKELRGSIMAFFYQSFARIFGYNLKVTYNPDGEDKNVEIIVQMIEAGIIK